MNPVLTTRSEEVAFGVALDGPTPHEGILALQRGEDVKAWLNHRHRLTVTRVGRVAVQRGERETVRGKL